MRAPVGPLSRPIQVHRVPPGGTDMVVEATAAEREALARDFGLPAIASLTGRFRIAGSLHRLQVTGEVTAEVTQTCVASLEPFDARVREPVDVDYTAADAFAGSDAEEAEMPDPIVNGRIDLGNLTAEFLALGLDPYPRKPGVALTFEEAPREDEHRPLAALEALRRDDETGSG